MNRADEALESWYLTGPTAAGKTTVGVLLAQRLDAEIISLDSMAVYRGMDVGTAKPPQSARGGIPHHLIDVAEPTEDYSLARFLDEARQALSEIRARGRKALFVGGTPLYLKAMLRGIFSGPPADWGLRRSLQAEAERQQPGYLWQRLAQVDPPSAKRLHPHDTRRLIRAIEVFEKTGRPISAWQQQFDAPRMELSRSKVFCLIWPRELLFDRIEQRVETMFDEGLVDEVRALLDRYGELSRTARQAVGYREVIDFLSGKTNLEDTIELVKTRTRQFARRQMTWFRSLAECRTLETTGQDSTEKLVARIVELTPRD